MFRVPKDIDGQRFLSFVVLCIYLYLFIYLRYKSVKTNPFRHESSDKSVSVDTTCMVKGKVVSELN